jgi:hypothetical protein
LRYLHWVQLKQLLLVQPEQRVPLQDQHPTMEAAVDPEEILFLVHGSLRSAEEAGAAGQLLLVLLDRQVREDQAVPVILVLLVLQVPLAVLRLLLLAHLHLLETAAEVVPALIPVTSEVHPAATVERETLMSIFPFTPQSNFCLHLLHCKSQHWLRVLVVRRPLRIDQEQVVVVPQRDTPLAAVVVAAARLGPDRVVITPMVGVPPAALMAAVAAVLVLLALSRSPL